MSKKTGVSMCGTIEYTRTQKKKQFINKVNTVKKKNSKVCIECENNKEGYCYKHKNWCSKVNYICNGYSKSYDEKLRENKSKKQSKKKKPTKKKSLSSKSQLGQVIKPNFKQIDKK